MIPSPSSLKEKIEHVTGNVAQLAEKYGRTANDVTVELAVKHQRVETIYEALTYHSHIAHNIIQQLVHTESELTQLHAPTHSTHIIGHLQKNKASKALSYSQCIETIDSYELAERLNNLQNTRIMQGSADKPFDIMLQINSSDADTQFGVSLNEAEELAFRINELPYLNICGLMTIGAHTDNEHDIALSFEKTRLLSENLRAQGITTLNELSMGMSGDMDIAIAEGSTRVRVGTAVFGKRELP
ncbi:MAG: YggS family pyridoxal phosphate-dependent enzyme [Actinomycetaceae bacterium]|nr:YggS family pyridoxal phosphate-dependent enzyme [Actinomycetaceae bacterium]